MKRNGLHIIALSMLTILLITSGIVRAQDTVAVRAGKSILQRPALPLSIDTSTRGRQDINAVSIKIPEPLDKFNKTTPIPLSPNAITDIINYQAKDSVAINMNERKAFLYKDGNIDYQSMNLKADDVEVDFNQQILSAKGRVDTAGKYRGRPYFKQGDAEYNADSIRFNYNSQKGIIQGVITQEGDGFLHGDKVKKVNDSVMYLDGGLYTTCNYVNPHYALHFTKSKLIMNDKIVTGPAYLTIQNIPTPLALPFAFFPLSKEKSSGLIVPSYGWMNGRGYYLRDGGWYFAMGDYMDLSLLGEIYTNLSWSLEAKSNYYRRYKYKGYFDVRYGRTKLGIRGDPNTYSVFGDFKVSWKHDQDAKANPNSRFSADVNLQSRNYNKNTTNTSDYFNSTTTSSISYSTSLWSVLNFSASARESYNAKTGMMNIQLPTISLSSNTFYPLRRKNPVGSYKWYENISMSYVLDGQNNLDAQDSNILKKSILNQMQYGVQQRIPVQSNLKVLRFLNWTNSISYNERWHWTTINKDIDETGALVIDTIKGFRSNRDFTLSSGLTTKVYGMFNFKYGPVKALRHVISPSLTFNFNPDFGSDKFGYWKQYTDTTGYVHRYSIFEQSLYGGPSDGRSGRLALSISNSLEMKVKPRHDTVGELKKVMLIENLSLSTFYDFARDSLNMADLTISGRTTLFKNLVINYNGAFTPYVVDTLGRKHDIFLFNATPEQLAASYNPGLLGHPNTLGQILAKSNSTWSAQLSYSLNNSTFKKGKSKSPKSSTPTYQTPYNMNPYAMLGSYANFSMPWNVSLSYTLSYVSNYIASQYNFENNVVQTLSLSGNFSLTDKWRFMVSTGYDFVSKGMSYTSINIHRDLHCWEMAFQWVPFGYYKSWNFQINIKAESLKDVKYKKDHSYQNNSGYYAY